MNVCSWPTGTSLSLWWKWRDISGFSFQGSFSISGKGYVHVHVLFDWAWSGLTGKYLARGPDVRTKRYAVDLHGWEKNIFLSDQTQSIGILLCDRFEKFCFNLIKTRQTGACGTTTKKILQKVTFPLFFRVRTRKSQFIKKLFFFCYFRFSLEFLQKSRVRTGLDSSFWTGSRQLVRPCACQLSVWFSMGLRARCRMGHLINVLGDDITTYFYHLKKLQLITWMLFLCSMRKGWGFKRLEELSGRKQKLASLLKMINDLRKIKRIGKSQSWVSSLMILKEDNFGISYRNLSYSHRRQFFFFSRRGTPT